MSLTICEYVRKGGKKVGLLVACRFYNQVVIGFSLCRKTDLFDKNKAEHLAWDRIACRRNAKRQLQCPQSLQEPMRKFLERCRKYYKDAYILLPTMEKIAEKSAT